MSPRLAVPRDCNGERLSAILPAMEREPRSGDAVAAASVPVGPSSSKAAGETRCALSCSPGPSVERVLHSG
jgi:hypothetical protein